MPHQFILLGCLLLLLAGRAHGQVPAADTTGSQLPAHAYTEILPVFPGLEPGDSALSPNQRVIKFLNDGLKPAQRVARGDVRGRVFFSFTVDAQGHTVDIKLVQGLRPDVDAEVLINAHRLDNIQWRPGIQNGRPVSVSFTVPISFNLPAGAARSNLAAGDSLDQGPYQKLVLPLPSWTGKRPQVPAGKGLVYGSCLQRFADGGLGQGQYVRLVNLTTHKSLRINVKPILNTVRESAFCYALPAGRYALFIYEFPDPARGGLRIHLESIRKPTNGPSARNLSATRYQFTVVPGKLHYLGTWNLANQNEPKFLNEKALLDGRLQPDYESLHFADAEVAIPQ
ncbi:energy transducer TonB [Hymenobacter caeli]|uniref:TonB C-terminal domain-containing protein n=1 Tax=Hymenobacter caeli TaxID=2735894 RepID=A0ABX2FM34_9BACT|nr:energy transducer TonB [Hymenobacter caeli]NRT17494.1 hypothetical protein [Hymenobacter caeli]